MFYARWMAVKMAHLHHCSNSSRWFEVRTFNESGCRSELYSWPWLLKVLSTVKHRTCIYEDPSASLHVPNRHMIDGEPRASLSYFGTSHEWFCLGDNFCRTLFHCPGSISRIWHGRLWRQIRSCFTVKIDACSTVKQVQVIYFWWPFLSFFLQLLI